MKTKPIIFALGFAALLCSCGGAKSSSQSWTTHYPETTSTQRTTYEQTSQNSSKTSSQSSSKTSSQSSSKTSSSTQPASEKSAVISFLKTYGTYSDGNYTISTSSTASDGFVLDMIWYNVQDDIFFTAVNLTFYSGSDYVSNTAGAGFTWGAFTRGAFVGSTTYHVSSTKLENSFSFHINFGTYPGCTITSYTSTKTGYSRSVSDDAQVCATCLARAINNLTKSLPSMGAPNTKLW